MHDELTKDLSFLPPVEDDTGPRVDPCSLMTNKHTDTIGQSRQFLS